MSSRQPGAKYSIHIPFQVPALVISWSDREFLSIDIVMIYDDILTLELRGTSVPIYLVSKASILHLSGGNVLILHFVPILTAGKRTVSPANLWPQCVVASRISNLISTDSAQQYVNQFMLTHVLPLCLLWRASTVLSFRLVYFSYAVNPSLNRWPGEEYQDYMG